MVTSFHAEDDRTGRKEQQGLEEGMRDQVEHARHVGAHADRRHHEAQLRDGRVGQHLLDIILPGGNRGGKERRDCADQRHHVLGVRHQRVERPGTRHQVDAGRDHGGGMDEGRDRGRAGHGIRQPDIQRDLGGFAGHADQQEQGDEQDHAGGGSRNLGSLHEDIIELEAAESPEHGECRQQEAEIADAVGDHGFLGRVRVGPGRPPERIHLIPEADQQERAQAHALPADEQHQVRVAADQDHHHGDEQVHEDKEAAVAARHHA